VSDVVTDARVQSNADEYWCYHSDIEFVLVLKLLLIAQIHLTYFPTYFNLDLFQFSAEGLYLYFTQEGNLFTFVCLYVCLSVCLSANNITQKVVDDCS